jgi:translocation and assembly module TamB
MAGQPLAGSLGADLALGGTLTAPDVKLDAALDGLEAAGRRLDKVTLAATAAGPIDKLGGDVKLVTTEPAGSLALATRYALDGKLLTLSRLSLTGPRTKIGGDLAVDLASQRATGTIKGSIDDLAALEPWHQQAGLKGAVQLQATLATPGGRQDATLHMDAKSIAGGFGAIAGVTLDASGKDLRGKPSVQADAKLTAFTQPTMAVDQASVSVDGPITDLQLAASAKGAQEGKPFDVQAKAQAGVLGDRKSVTLQALSGSWQGQSIKLRQPAKLVLDKGTLDLDTLDLVVGDAGIRAKGSLEGGRVRADVTLLPSPLSALAAFGGPPVQGTARGTLTVSGRAAAPDATLQLNVDKLEPAGGFGPGSLKPLALVVQADVRGGRALTARLELQKLKKGPFTVTASLPLRLSLQPFAFDLPESAPLDAHLTGKADLAELAALAALDGQRVAGELATDLSLGGTLAAPRVNGTLTIANGLVEDSISGAMLRNLKLVVAGEGDQIVIRQLTAQDRTTGKLTGKGQFQLVGLGLGRLSVAVDLDRARLLDDEYGSATVSGNVAVAGTLVALGVNGKLKINRADLGIPDSMASAPPTLNPQQIYAPGMAPTPPKPAASAAPTRIALDIKVDMPEQIFIRGRGLDAEWGGSLKITGTAASPVIVGTIAERRGFLDLLDRRFTLADSTITFTGGQPPVPDLAIKAVASSPNLKATVDVTGPATQPKITLSSDPPLPQDEIISELLFRRDTASITPLQAVQLANAVSTLQGGGFDALGKLRSLAGLDTLSLNGSGASDDTSLSAGKYISNNVYLQVQKGMTPQSGQASVQVELTPNVSASTNVTETGQSGVSLQWKHDY